LRSFLSDWWEAAVLFTTYQRGKPQSRPLGGKCGGGKTPLQISRRKDQAGALEPKKRLQGRVIYIPRHSPADFARGCILFENSRIGLFSTVSYVVFNEIFLTMDLYFFWKEVKKA
jgi:hypothetical protein